MEFMTIMSLWIFFIIWSLETALITARETVRNLNMLPENSINAVILSAISVWMIINPTKPLFYLPAQLSYLSTRCYSGSTIIFTNPHLNSYRCDMTKKKLRKKAQIMEHIIVDCYQVGVISQIWSNHRIHENLILENQQFIFFNRKPLLFMKHYWIYWILKSVHI